MNQETFIALPYGSKVWHLEWSTDIIMTILIQIALLLATHLFLSFSQTLSILSPQNFTTSLTTLVTEPVKYQCYPARLLSHDGRANTYDCARAVWSLPGTTTPGVFHTGGNPDQDPFVLPLTTKNGSCQVNVGLKFGRDDGSSWPSIALAASRVIMSCAVGDIRVGQTGGIAILGTNEFLTVSVGSPPRAVTTD